MSSPASPRSDAERGWAAVREESPDVARLRDDLARMRARAERAEAALGRVVAVLDGPRPADAAAVVRQVRRAIGGS